MNIVIVGGGPTGVELAGSLAEMKKNVLQRELRSGRHNPSYPTPAEIIQRRIFFIPPLS